jgi:uncharacterized phiE125 gp8 family phage protein
MAEMHQIKFEVVEDTAPANEPISAAEAKAFAKIDSSDDDTLVGTLIKAARIAAQNWNGVQLTNATWLLYMEEWPDEILVPYPPLSSVTHIKYYDGDGNQQTWTNTLYQIDTSAWPGRIKPAYNESYPNIRSIYKAIEVKYVAGFGADETSVPENFKLAIKYAVAAWYKDREQVNILPEAAIRLLDQEPASVFT